MQQHRHSSAGHAPPEQQFELRRESQRLADSVKTLARAREEISRQILELERLLKHLQSSQAEARTLRAQINSLAERLGLDPV